MTGLERQSHSSVYLSEVMLDVYVCVCVCLCDHGWGSCWIAVLYCSQQFATLATLSFVGMHSPPIASLRRNHW